jgi:hypothetical protein
VKRLTSGLVGLTVALFLSPAATQAQSGYPGGQVPSSVYNTPTLPPGYPGATAVNGTTGGITPVATSVPANPTQPNIYGGRALVTPYALPTLGASPYATPVGNPYGDATGNTTTSSSSSQTGAAPAAAPVMALPVAPLRLSDGPGTVDVSVANAPPFRSVHFSLTYDPQSVVVTGVVPGALITGTGGQVQILGLNLSIPGQITYGIALNTATVWPQGNGSIAQVTFAPIAQNPSSPLTLSDAGLVSPDNTPIAVTTRAGFIGIPAVPPPAVQTQSVASATAFAATTPSTGSGTGPALSAVTGAVGAHAPILGWLMALAIGMAVALVGWALGRRPTGPGG